MKLTAIIALGMATMPLVSKAAPAAEPSEAVEKGFVDLLKTDKPSFRNYNAKELNPNWKLENGELSLVGRGGDIVSVKEYESFDLRFEWKIQKGGNSGLFIGAKESNRNIYEDAIEMQILGNEGFPNLDDSHIAGSIYELYSSKREWAKPAGEWNEVRVLKQGTVVEYTFNGHQIAKFDIASPEFKEKVAKTKFKAFKDFGAHSKGFIGFQDHGDSNGLVLRKLRIKEL